VRGDIWKKHPSKILEERSIGRRLRIWKKAYRIIKAGKDLKSNHQPITTMPAKPCPEVP